MGINFELGNRPIIAQVGFQLTVLATAGILLLMPVIEEWFERQHIPTVAGEPAAATIAATLFTAPVIAIAFGGGGAWVVLPNLFLEAIVQCILFSGLLFVVVAISIPSLASVAAIIPTGLVWMALGIVRTFAQLFAIPLLQSQMAVFLSYVLPLVLVGWWYLSVSSLRHDAIKEVV